jgi:carbon monoxide dehydrogenase subunit G
MQLEHSFTVPVLPAEAWRVLLDLERVAPCMPGATLESVTGTEFAGRVKVKVGPITVTYRGTGRFTEQDGEALRATVEAKAKEMRGTGTATATVRAALRADGGATRVDVTTDLAITGKPAQFGRGVMADIGNKLIGQFAACLAQELAAPASTTSLPAAADPTSPPTPWPQGASKRGAAEHGEAPELESRVPAGRPPVPPERRRTADPIDLLEAAGGPLAKRLGPAAALVGLAAVLFAVSRRRRQRRPRR